MEALVFEDVHFKAVPTRGFGGSLIGEAPPGAGTTLLRSSRQSTATKLAKDAAPTANSALNNNGQLTQLMAGADEFQWGVGNGG